MDERRPEAMPPEDKTPAAGLWNDHATPSRGLPLSSAPIGWSAYTQLARTALAVVVRRADGWACYVMGVPGENHRKESVDVLRRGDKLDEWTARAICANRFHPAIDPGRLPYCL